MGTALKSLESPVHDDAAAPVTHHVAAAVAAKGISKTFGATRALRGVDLAVQAGEVHALLGQNGSGKSTLIKVIAGYHDPDPGGLVSIGGTPVTRDRSMAAYRLGLRCVHQNLGLIDEFDAIENINLGRPFLHRRGRMIDWAAEETRVAEALGRIGVDMDVRRPLGACTAVERSAVAITRAVADIAGAGGCLVLDEPTASMTTKEADRLFEMIDQLKSAGVAVIYVSHRLDEVFAIADRLSVLRGGQVVRSGVVAELEPDRVVEDIVGGALTSTRKPVRAVAPLPAVLRAEALEGEELRGVDLEVRAGEILGVSGLEGSGRSELCRVLAGLTDGVGGRVQRERARRGERCGPVRENDVAYVPADRTRRGAVVEFSTRENMTLPQVSRFARFGWVRRRAENPWVEEWIDRLGVRPSGLECAFGHLSGGNQQKVVLAKWLGTSPAVLIVDEPTQGVDIGARAEIYGLLREACADGLAVVVASSDVGELVALADRVIALCRGRAVAEFDGEHVSEAQLMSAIHGIPVAARQLSM